MKSTDFVVARHDFQQCKFIETAIPDGEDRGRAAVRQVYLDTLAGRIPPDQGHMLFLPG